MIIVHALKAQFYHPVKSSHLASKLEVGSKWEAKDLHNNTRFSVDNILIRVPVWQVINTFIYEVEYKWKVRTISISFLLVVNGNLKSFTLVLLNYMDIHFDMHCLSIRQDSRYLSRNSY